MACRVTFENGARVIKEKNDNGIYVDGLEPLVRLRLEYISDGDEAEFLWLH